jgi:predicted transcriptional regulator
MADETALDTIELATEVTIAWLGNHNVRASADDVPAFLRSIHATIVELESATSDAGTAGNETEGEGEAEPVFTPAVSVRKSLASKDHIISLIDGKPYKTLRRHLATHGLTPEQYRERYNLKPDYPMTASSYSEARRAMAHKIGLGAKGRAAQAGTPAAQEAEPAPAKRATRRRKDDAPAK